MALNALLHSWSAVSCTDSAHDRTDVRGVRSAIMDMRLKAVPESRLVPGC